MWDFVSPDLAYVLSALTLGLAASLHCGAMCGPLVALLGGQSVRSGIVYHAGRIGTYTVLGVLFGSLGRSLAQLGLHQGLSIAAGIAMLLLIVLQYAPVGSRFTPHWVVQLQDALRHAVARLMGREPGLLRTLAMGALNGLLPCGMVYVALAGASAAGTAPMAALFMALFGLGTLPLLAALTAVHKRARQWLSPFWGRRLAVGAGVVVGLLLVVRGLDLNVPYLSPHLVPTHAESLAGTPVCH